MLVLVVLLIGVLVDPCTFRLNNSDVSPSAPLWQTVLSLIDVLLLVIVSVLSFEGNAIRAVQILIIETAYNVFLSVVYLGRFGLLRYAEHFGHHEYLMLYLALIGLRLVLMLIWTPALQNSASGALD
jgi:hypothetical protein